MAPSPAPFPRRTAAFLLDQFVVLLSVTVPLAAVGVEVLTVGMPLAAIGLDIPLPVVPDGVFIALMGGAFTYHTLFEWLEGTTLGKHALGLAVVADDGSRLGFRGSLLRNALRLVDGLGYWGVATLVIVYRGDGKRLGDVVGRTLVVYRSER